MMDSAQSRSDSKSAPTQFARWTPLLAAVFTIAAVMISVRRPDSELLIASVAGLLVLVVVSLGRSIDPRIEDSGERVDDALIRKVLPVWQRHLMATRALADNASDKLLERFGDISEGLDSALASTEDGSSGFASHRLDSFEREQQSAIDALARPLEKAVRARSSMADLVENVFKQVGQLGAKAQEIKDLSRRTKMVAFNASVEAVSSAHPQESSGDSRGGFAVVAAEVRQLAEQSSFAISQIIQMLDSMSTSLAGVSAIETSQDCSPEELRAQTDQCARRVIDDLLRQLRSLRRSGARLRLASDSIRENVEQVMVGFQANDRLTQMLDSIAADIARMSKNLANGGDNSERAALEWLERLERSYTMEEQRSEHHGHDASNRTSGIEFL